MRFGVLFWHMDEVMLREEISVIITRFGDVA